MEGLEPDSIDNWDDLCKKFIDNFQGTWQKPRTRFDLAQCKQEQNDTLWSYIRRFFKKKATCINLPERDIIDCFHNGLYDRRVHLDFGRNRPHNIEEMRELINKWADAEDLHHEKFEGKQKVGDGNSKNQ